MNPKTHIDSYLFPALFALGALLGTFAYFTLPFEPSVTLLGIMSIFLIPALYFMRNHYPFFMVSFLMFAFVCALLNAAWQIQNRQPNFLEKKYENTRLWVVGQVGASASYNGRDKITLESVKIYGVDAENTPKKVRISSSQGRLSIFNVGDWVAVEAMLMAPAPPKYAGDYNFRRQAWMDEIGATGYVMGQVYKTSWPDGYKSNTYYIQHMRNALTEKIVGSHTEFDERAVMAALMTGKKTYISDDIYNAYRQSGLAHLLAISGLHIGLIGGFVFFATRRLCGFSERITLRYNTKVPAAILAIIACLAYTAIAGGTLPTLRAFIMAAFIFIGFVVGRLHNTLRIFMMTLVLVLFLWPQSLLTASFQMSFVAVFALTLWNEFKQKEAFSSVKVVQGLTYTKGVFLTSVVAGLATMPIAAWHFGSIHFVGFFVNVLAIPLTAFVIMPSSLLSVVMIPFGAENPFLYAMQYGVFWLNSLAVFGAEFPHGHYDIEQGEVFFLAFSVFILLLSLYLNKYKKFTVGLLGVSVLFCFFNSDSNRKILWLRGGQTIIAGNGEGAFLPLRVDGSSYEKRLLSNFKMASAGQGRCDSMGCVYDVLSHKYLVMADGVNATEEDCAQVDFIMENIMAENSICTNAVQFKKGVESGEIVINKKTALFVPYTLHENRIWH